jgi:hypothetical protein
MIDMRLCTHPAVAESAGRRIESASLKNGDLEAELFQRGADRPHVAARILQRSDFRSIVQSDCRSTGRCVLTPVHTTATDQATDQSLASSMCVGPASVRKARRRASCSAFLDIRALQDSAGRRKTQPGFRPSQDTRRKQCVYGAQRPHSALAGLTPDARPTRALDVFPQREKTATTETGGLTTLEPSLLAPAGSLTNGVLQSLPGTPPGIAELTCSGQDRLGHCFNLGTNGNRD